MTKRLNERDSLRPRTDPPRSILNVRPEHVEGVKRYEPSPGLAPFVEYFWVVRWDLATPEIAETVPQPSVQLVIEAGASAVVGVARTRFTRVLHGRGRIVGARFRPGAFRCFVDAPVSSLAGRRRPLRDVFGPAARSLESRALSCADDRDAIAALEAFLLARGPRLDDGARLAARIVARSEADRAVTRVADLASEFGVGVRALQRLFGDYVGASPKQVIVTHRLLDAAFRATSERDPDWAGLALELGFADQAHLIREFKKLVGRPPADYASSIERPDGRRASRGAGPRARRPALPRPR